MKRYVLITVLVIGYAHGVGIAEKTEIKTDLLVKKKKPQRQTPSRVKEQIGDSYGRMLKQQSTIVEQLAQGNKLLVDRTHELLCDDCDATLEQLQGYRTTLEQFEKELHMMETKVCSMLDHLHLGLPSANKK